MNQHIECRICFDDEEEKKFISPCLCNGTSKNVHIECLETWRRINIDRPAFDKCMECHYKYKLKYRYPKERNIYHNVTYKQVMYFIYLIPLTLSILLNFSNERGELLYLLDFGQTNKSKDICHKIYNQSEYCHATSLYGALKSADLFSYTIFNTSILAVYQVFFMTLFYIYKNKKTIKRYNEFNKINRNNFIYWLFNIFKFFFVYYSCIFLLTEPTILLGYSFFYIILEPIIVFKFIEKHGNSIKELNDLNPSEILEYNSELDDDYFGEEIDYRINLEEIDIEIN